MNPLPATSLDDLVQRGQIPQITVRGDLQGRVLSTGQSRWTLHFARPQLLMLKSGPVSVTGTPGIDPMPELSPRFLLDVIRMGPAPDGSPPVPGPGFTFDDLVAQGYVQSVTLIGTLRLWPSQSPFPSWQIDESTRYAPPLRTAAAGQIDGSPSVGATRIVTGGRPFYLDVQGLQIPLDLPLALLGLAQGGTVQVTGRPKMVPNIGGPDLLVMQVDAASAVQPVPPLLPSPVSAPPPSSPAGPAPALPAASPPAAKSRTIKVVVIGLGLAGVLGLWWRRRARQGGRP